MKSLVNWRIFFALLILSLLSVCAIFPYLLTLQGDILKQATIPISTIFLIQLVQSAILFSGAIFVGLYANKKVQFHLPALEPWTAHMPSALWGIITAILIYTTDYIFSLMGATISTHQNAAPTWQTLLAAFYGGITEEVLMRLFLMTLCIWIGMNVTKRSKPTQTIIIVSILIAAVVFGLGHLPITASLTKLTPLIVVRAIILNGIGGVIFGWIYWKKGLQAAIIAHFTTDIFLLTLLPLMFS